MSEKPVSGTPSPALLKIPKAFEATMKIVASKGPEMQVKYMRRLENLLATVPKKPCSYSSFQCPPQFELKSTFDLDLLKAKKQLVEALDEPMDVGPSKTGPSKSVATVSANNDSSQETPRRAVDPPRSPSKKAPVRDRLGQPRDRVAPSYVRPTGRSRPVHERVGSRPVGLDPALVLPVQGSVNQAELLRLNGIELAGKLRTARRRQSRTRNRMRHRGASEDQLYYRYFWSKGVPKGGAD